MLTNNIKKGMKLKMTGGRTAIMMDNKKGIIRLVQTNADPAKGIYHEIGSCYVDEILQVFTGHIWEKIDIAPKHREQMSKIHEQGF